MIETLREAGTGWSAVLGRKPDWTRHFRFDAGGLNGAVVAYGVGVLAAIVLASLRMGFPPPEVAILLLIGHLLPLVALIIATGALTALGGYAGSSLHFYVPVLFILALMKVIEGVSMLIGVPLAGAILALTAVLAFRLAQANGLALWPAIGYGLGLFVLLAALPIALYMLINLF